jgi:hypothetical protein
VKEAEVRELYSETRQRGEAGRQEALKEERRESGEVERFRQQLESWAGCCVLCRLKGEKEKYHEREGCKYGETSEWEDMESAVRLTEDEMFKKKRFERYACCYFCGIPQGICGRWRATDKDGGSFEGVVGKRCQYKGVLAKIYTGLLAWHGEEGGRVVRRALAQDNRRVVEVYEWLGKRIKWGGLEASNMCRVCVYLGELEKRE